jgi:predicted GNAT family N-acyltransferase
MTDGHAVRVKIAETPGEWTGLVAVRLAVFCDEQGVPISAELDEHDRNAVHALALLPSDGVVPEGLAVARRGTATRASAQAGRYLPLSLAGARGGHRDDGAVARAVGGARLLRRPNGVAQIGRVAVLPAWRGTGLGERLMRLLEELALARGYREAMVHSQVQVQSFYERRGYVVDPKVAPFNEDGILHVRMTKVLSLDM